MLKHQIRIMETHIAENVFVKLNQPEYKIFNTGNEI